MQFSSHHLFFNKQKLFLTIKKDTYLTLQPPKGIVCQPMLPIQRTHPFSTTMDTPTFIQHALPIPSFDYSSSLLLHQKMQIRLHPILII